MRDRGEEIDLGPAADPDPDQGQNLGAVALGEEKNLEGAALPGEGANPEAGAVQEQEINQEVGVLLEIDAGREVEVHQNQEEDQGEETEIEVYPGSGANLEAEVSLDHVVGPAEEARHEQETEKVHQEEDAARG